MHGLRVTQDPAIGFSQYTCLPASSAATVTGMWKLLCRHTSTASMSSRSSSARKSAYVSVMPLAAATRASSCAFTSARATTRACGILR